MNVPEDNPEPVPDGLPDHNKESVSPSSLTPVLSIIIPTLNAARALPRVLESLAGEKLDREIIVADGGSTDGTQRIAEAHGLRLVVGPSGRGQQLSAGAQVARGEWFLFLHADSALQRGWGAIVRGFTGNTENSYRAGYFQLLLDDTTAAARRIENLANWRARTLGLPYGDQGLLISRAFYNHLDGYASIPLMEDVDIVRRIGRRRLIALPSAVTTSARRYQRDGFWLRPIWNLICLGFYFAGLPPRLIDRLYR